MSAFVNQLRARGEPVRMAPEGATAITVRVEMAEIWDMVKLIVSPDERVLGLKRRALSVLAPTADVREDAFVIKLKGWEVIDENATLASVGAVDGSSFLLQHRLRRPVR